MKPGVLNGRKFARGDAEDFIEAREFAEAQARSTGQPQLLLRSGMGRVVVERSIRRQSARTCRSRPSRRPSFWTAPQARSVSCWLGRMPLLVAVRFEFIRAHAESECGGGHEYRLSRMAIDGEGSAR